MPTYDYHCTACGHRWEQMQSIKSEPYRKCPKCKKQTAEREIGIGAAILTGGTGSAGSESEAKGSKTKESAASAGGTGKEPSGKAGAGAGAGQSAGAGTGAAASASASSKTPSPSATPAASGEPDHTSKATHPAREGRGFGNIKDAIARQRKEQSRFGGSGFGGGTGGGKGPGQGGGKSFGAPRKGGSRGR